MFCRINKSLFCIFFVIIDINTAANLKQGTHDVSAIYMQNMNATFCKICLLYTSDAADE